MKIGVMSDTHGRIDLMQRAADRMTDEFSVEAVVHLGDDYADAQKLDLHGQRLFVVPGMYEAAWDSPDIPHRVITDFGGALFLLSHAPESTGHDRPEDINPETARSQHGVDVILHGHTHKYRIYQSGDGLVAICPGHLKADADKGQLPTFAVIEVSPSMLHVSIIELFGGTIEQREMSLTS